MRALETDADRVEWSRRYQMALRRFLRQGKSMRPQPAVRLGRRAVTLGLETLDVARAHEHALTALAPPDDSSRNSRHKTTRRAKVFFEEVIAPIEATHHAALMAEIRIDQLTRTLHQRRKESSASAKRLQSAIPQHQAAKVVLKKSADQHARLLAEAQRQQNHLRLHTRKILSAQEHERKKTGAELRDDIAQAMLAIDLSLLALKASASVNTGNVEKELAKVQRLVEELSKRGRVGDQ